MLENIAVFSFWILELTNVIIHKRLHEQKHWSLHIPVDLQKGVPELDASIALLLAQETKSTECGCGSAGDLDLLRDLSFPKEDATTIILPDLDTEYS